MNMKDDAVPVKVSVKNWVDSRGKKAKVDPTTVTTYASSDENLVKVIDNGDGTFSVGPGDLTGVDADDNGVIGEATVTATADADLGEGTKPVVAAGAVTVVAGDAAVGELQFGDAAPPTPTP